LWQRPHEAAVEVVNKSVVSGFMPDRHLMIDIETYDTEVTATILAIGAVVFNPRADTYEDVFHTTVSAKSQHDRTVSTSTQEWWKIQSPEAQANVFGGEQISLSLALDNFARWVNRLKPTCTRIWAKSPDFDCSIMKNACEQHGVIWPFKFWESRCCRTIIELAYPEGDFPHIDMEGPAHDALADAKKQALEIQHAYYKLGV